ncbi:HNH endonuclease signature motif containing protein [Methylobacterium pseudosasicola]|uniref:HNH endonuclease n=1 Tax=Methylobacterium pseudosasicola TaxID=582667 RepID=A0A1I4UR84_9HYPH|nr:HNH endonuclease signature motif containing protein [Methylobacterium pseudosasicola]SFM91517.1 HNH endonuclease [Methylobacterium pseudosasicola]
MDLERLFDQRRDQIARRLAAKVIPGLDGCLLFTGTTDRGRYGQFYIDRFKVAAHRVAYAFANGPIPDGHLVCHRCDNPTCINVEHLFLGSALDNNVDQSVKNRTHQPFGGVGRYRKLTRDDVLRIKTERTSGRALAADMGVAPNTVRKIRRGETWTHVSPAVSAEVL